MLTFFFKYIEEKNSYLLYLGRGGISSPVTGDQSLRFPCKSVFSDSNSWAWLVTWFPCTLLDWVLYQGCAVFVL